MKIISLPSPGVAAVWTAGLSLFCLVGCKSADTACCTPASPSSPVASATNTISGRETNPSLRRSTYTPRVYPVDERGFSPVDKALANAYAREDLVANDAEGSCDVRAVGVHETVLDEADGKVGDVDPSPTAV